MQLNNYLLTAVSLEIPDNDNCNASEMGQLSFEYNCTRIFNREEDIAKTDKFKGYVQHLWNRTFVCIASRENKLPNEEGGCQKAKGSKMDFANLLYAGGQKAKNFALQNV